MFTDTNEQISLFKKLVILNLVKKDEINLKIYMYKSTGKVPRTAKENILNRIYDNECKESSYSLLDLLLPFRYLIKNKVKELKNLFELNHIILDKKVVGMSSFIDIEYAIYEGNSFMLCV